MIDIKIIRENPEKVKKNCMRRECDVDVNLILSLDEKIRNLKRETDNMRAERNRLSRLCKDNPDARVKVKKLKEELALKEREMNEKQTELEKMLSLMPNFLHPEVPDGESDHDNKEIRKWGTVKEFDFTPLDHQALGEKLGIIDTKRGAKVAQSGFYYWKGKGAQLCNALFFWTQSELIKRGFISFITPCVAKQETLFGTGYLPFFRDQIYNIEDENLTLIGTSEQTLVGYHANETLDANMLPLCYTAFSPCFRTEAGSYGKETRGIFRVHQFHKVEQIVFCLPEDSEKYHLFCLENEEYLLRKLKIPYRVVEVCVGDMGAPGYRKYDIEAWYPGYNGYREVTSNTNLTDFQARRLNIKYKSKDKKGFVHTISATAATDRFVIAILENNQNKDGVVSIPEILVPYTGFDKIEP